MRIRQIKPAFWADSTISELPERTRLFYIGLWCVADDAGWLRWDTAEVGRELYGFEHRRTRENRVMKMLAELQETGRVIVHDCGHVEIPKLPEHQHLAVAAKQVKTALNDHTKACLTATRDDLRKPADTRLGKGNGDGNGQVGHGTVSEEKVDARGASEFQDRMTKNGAALAGRLS